jgi:hypothetical protein
MFYLDFIQFFSLFVCVCVCVCVCVVLGIEPRASHIQASAQALEICP